MDRIRLLDHAAILLAQHRLTGWTLELPQRTGQRLGYCDHKTKTIILNDYYAANNSETDVCDTLLHEIAHALTPGHGHDELWKAVARRLGATPKACCQSQVQILPGKYQATCPSCGKIFHRYRKPRYKCQSKETTAYYCPAKTCGKERGRLVFVRHADAK